MVPRGSFRDGMIPAITKFEEGQSNTRNRITSYSYDIWMRNEWPLCSFRIILLLYIANNEVFHKYAHSIPSPRPNGPSEAILSLIGSALLVRNIPIRYILSETLDASHIPLVDHLNMD